MGWRVSRLREKWRNGGMEVRRVTRWYMVLELMDDGVSRKDRLG